MSVLVYVEAKDKLFKKAAWEVLTYGKKIAQAAGDRCIALVCGEADEISVLDEYGADEIIHVTNRELNDFDSAQHAHVIAHIAKERNAQCVIMNHSAKGKSLIGRVAVRLNAGSVSGVNSIPELHPEFSVKKSVFSGKASATFAITTPIKVLSLMGNTLPPEKIKGKGETITLSIELPERREKVIDRKIVSGRVPLPEAERVVSAGRGMKGPENWSIIEELADALNATTACSRPVADSGWRPHHEHVGQTGVAIRPDLYIAAGISGAIQHLAGVNNSKVIVVINKDPEAPFFKAADYGVLGDLFEVVPKFTEALKKYKS
ncbi:MAG TPA: electron transfer flavoprotein subunit alpha/FixB family protein [Saprospiraceae bacterium]|nr:electron transfer flavoprotein subunit alpha/FixB family protein [Saprospiraceae bacterium]